MSVAGPVVPTKEDGGVDQDRSDTYITTIQALHCSFSVLII